MLFRSDIALLDVTASGASFGDPLFMDSTGFLDIADASSSSTMPCRALALESGSGEKKVLLRGFVRDDSWTWTPGGDIYISTSGTLTQTKPSASGEQVQIVGFATHADRMYFNPNYMLIEVA